MGDMKTPDFDDLLAAFDIPDATGLDAKEPIQGSHEEAESQLKHPGMCLGDSLLSSQAVTTADIPAVSVIVKNTSRQESLESFGDRLHSGPPLQNGFRGQETSVDSTNTTDPNFSASFVSSLNGESSRELPGEAPIQHKPDGAPVFSRSVSHFSPVSSPECEDTRCDTDEIQPMQGRLCFSEASGFVEPSVPDNQKKMDLSVFDDSTKDSFVPNDVQKSRAESTRSDVSDSYKSEKSVTVHSALTPPGENQRSVDTNCNSGTTVDASTSVSHAKSHTSKFSSCLEALVALNARKDPSDPTSVRESSAVQSDCIKPSPKVPLSPRSPRSPLEVVKRMMKPPDSPVSIYSDSSGKASPAVASGSPPVIPRVRIKTIKTTSGRIKRMATSVVPDSETDEVHSAYESSPSQSIISEDSYWTVSPHHSQTAETNVGKQAKGNPSGASAPKVFHRKSEDKPRRTGGKQSSAVLNRTGAAKRTVSNQVKKPKRVSASAGQTTSTNFLPKAMHLASLNLVPHSVAASVAARSTSHQHSQPTLSSTVYSTVPLVHQVKTAAAHPHTPVQNTGAGTLNRLLHQTNPVPPYVPNLTPPSESNISLPPHGYRCLECGDSFAVERSLSFHYNRRSVHIEVRCAHCAKTMVFFNKCALWAHAREHKNNGKMMQCTHLRMNPISEGQMFVPMSADPVNAGSFTSLPPLPLPSSHSEAVLPLYQDGVHRHPRGCPECNQQLPDLKAFAGHFQRLSGDVEKLVCEMCSMLLPNKCSFRAHQRLHAHKSPYCCPECGALSRSADIQKHVKENCLHYARKAWYKCLHCDTVFKTIQSQKSHAEEKHCEAVHKCTGCTAIFKTFDGCDEHMKNRHPVTTVTSKSVLQCSCGKVFKKKQALHDHFNQSIHKRLSCVFKCPECNSVFSQKLLLMQHFKTVHAGIITMEMEKNREVDAAEQDQDSHPAQQQKSHSLAKRTESPRKKPERDKGPHVKLTCWTCGECLQKFPDRDSFVAHMKANHRKSVKRFSCHYCEKAFKTATIMKRHIRTEHSGNKRTYTCWYCTDNKKTFRKSVTLKNHISLMHGIKNPDLGQMPKSSIQECKKAFGKGFKSAGPAAGPQTEGPEHAGGLGASPSKRLKTQFRCSKCGFVTDDGAQFQQHIPQHKTDENTPQCLHCGLCFTSVLSLNRHLFIVHKVRDPADSEAGKEQRQQQQVDVREQEQDNQPVRSAEGDAVNDGLAARSESEPSQEEPQSPHCAKNTDCNSKLRC
ncbi:zinc finger protein 592 [Salarias fasciatus]|uniref:C2H2-type domain-containing protein n=1 Tax=Salarias fasciatus TaxID=181472 RepID=A0A672I1J7_SALFA|nr:zinc finger protein 592 [Salarias fasciatus]